MFVNGNGFNFTVKRSNWRIFQLNRMLLSPKCSLSRVSKECIVYDWTNAPEKINYTETIYTAIHCDWNLVLCVYMCVENTCIFINDLNQSAHYFIR